MIGGNFVFPWTFLTRLMIEFVSSTMELSELELLYEFLWGGSRL
jgi:hypothetical protein